MTKKLFAITVVVSVTACATRSIDSSRDGERVYLGLYSDPKAVTADNRPITSPYFGRYPLEVGNVWTYKNVYKTGKGMSGDPNIKDRVTITWTSVVTIRERVETPQGTMVLRDCTVRDMTYDGPESDRKTWLDWLNNSVRLSADNSHLLIFKSGLVEEITPSGWDETKRALTDEALKALDRVDNPDVNLSLAARLRGELPKLTGIGYWVWTVEGNETVTTPYGPIPDVVHLVSMANGGRSHTYFKDGIGYVRDYCMHGGSYYEEEKVLMSFERHHQPRKGKTHGQ